MYFGDHSKFYPKWNLCKQTARNAGFVFLDISFTFSICELIFLSTIRMNVCLSLKNVWYQQSASQLPIQSNLPLLLSVYFSHNWSVICWVSFWINKETKTLGKRKNKALFPSYYYLPLLTSFDTISSCYRCWFLPCFSKNWNKLESSLTHFTSSFTIR